MTINNPEMFVASLWDWGFLNSCFGDTGIRVSDIDGVVERNGNVLFLETKLPGARMTRGQDRLFSSFQRDGNTVFVIHGNPGRPVQLEIRRRDLSSEMVVCGDLADLNRYVSYWFRWADKHPKGH